MILHIDGFIYYNKLVKLFNKVIKVIKVIKIY